MTATFGTTAALAPMWAGAAQGKFVAPNLPQDTRDPTQIALKAIAALHAGQGPTPAANALAGAQMQGLTLQPAAAPQAAPVTAPAAALAAPQPAPRFPQFLERQAQFVDEVVGRLRPLRLSMMCQRRRPCA